MQGHHRHFWPLFLLGTSFLSLSGQEGAQNPNEAENKPTPKVERINETLYRIGNVEIDAAKKSVSFPAKLNMVEGLLEYAIVMPHGKMHEALLVTEVDALELNLAFKLLNFKTSDRYFPKVDAQFNRIPQEPPSEEELKTSRINIVVEWPGNGKNLQYSLASLIQDERNKTAMPDSRWLYTGSVVDNGNFIASQTGDVVAIFNNRSAMVNFDGPGQDNDEIWVPKTKLLPVLGSPVRVIMTSALAQSEPPATTPKPAN